MGRLGTRLESMNAANQDKKKKTNCGLRVASLLKTAAESGSVQWVLFTQIYRPDIKRHYHGNI